MNREQKAAVIEEVAGQIRESEAIIAVDYRGISVPQAAELRTRLNDADATFRVVKNRLSIRAADAAGNEALKGVLEGPTALTFVRGDLALAAKALTQFQREAPNLEVKGGTLGGDALTAEQIGAIARLPGREQLYAQLVGVVAAPLTGLVRGLGSMIQGLAIQLEQIREQGLVGQGAPAAAPAGDDGAPAAEGGGDSAAAEAGDAAAGSESGDTAAEEAAPAEEATPAEEAPGDPVAAAETAEQETASDSTPSEGDGQEEG